MALYAQALLVALVLSLSGSSSALEVITTAGNTLYKVFTFADLQAAVGTPSDSPVRTTGKLDTVGIYNSLVFTSPLVITGAFYIINYSPNIVFDLSGVVNDEAFVYDGPFTNIGGFKQRETIVEGILFDGKKVPRTAACILVEGGLIKLRNSGLINCNVNGGDAALTVLGGVPNRKTKIQFVGDTELENNSGGEGGAYVVSGRGAKAVFCYTTFGNNRGESAKQKDGVVAFGGESRSCYGTPDVPTPPATTSNGTTTATSGVATSVRSPNAQSCPYSECKFYAQQAAAGNP